MRSNYRWVIVVLAHLVWSCAPATSSVLTTGSMPASPSAGALPAEPERAPSGGAIESPEATPDAPPPVTERSWREHPSVKEIRAIVQEVQELENSGKLTTAERSGHESCENYDGDMYRTIRRDTSGKARKLTLDAGSEDSAVTVDAYYDTQTKLRFIFVKAAAVNDTVYEYRLYFSPDGKKLWEDQKLVSGPGYTFPTPWPEDLIPRDPEARFASSMKCD